MKLNRNGKEIVFGRFATFVTFALAAYGAEMAGMQVANVIVRNIKKS